MQKRTILIMCATAIICSCGNQTKQSKDNIVKVKTALVGETSSSSGLAYPGTIEEMSGTDLSFASAGTIKSLNITEGQMVGAGQVLGVLDPTTMENSVAVAIAATQQARETLNQAEDVYNRMKSLHDKGSLPEIRWVEVQTKISNARLMLKQAQASEQIAKKGKTDTRLVAPFSGYISKKEAEVGQNVIPSISIARLVKIDQVKVCISVPEDEISKVQIGQQIHFTVASLGNAIFSGRIQEKGVSADPLSRTYKVKAIVANAGHKLLPGMICDASIMENSTAEQITLPAQIIQIDIDNKPFVWTVENGKAHKRHVMLGDNIGSSVIIASGLTTKDKVIMEGQQKVYDGGQVRE